MTPWKAEKSVAAVGMNYRVIACLGHLQLRTAGTATPGGPKHRRGGGIMPVSCSRQNTGGPETPGGGAYNASILFTATPGGPKHRGGGT